MVFNPKNTKKTIKKIKKMSDSELKKFIKKCTLNPSWTTYGDVAIEEAFERDLEVI